jgi:hypothetical protein
MSAHMESTARRAKPRVALNEGYTNHSSELARFKELDDGYLVVFKEPDAKIRNTIHCAFCELLQRAEIPLVFEQWNCERSFLAQKFRILRFKLEFSPTNRHWFIAEDMVRISEEDKQEALALCERAFSVIERAWPVRGGKLKSFTFDLWRSGGTLVLGGVISSDSWKAEDCGLSPLEIAKCLGVP